MWSSGLKRLSKLVLGAPAKVCNMAEAATRDEQGRALLREGRIFASFWSLSPSMFLAWLAWKGLCNMKRDSRWRWPCRLSCVASEISRSAIISNRWISVRVTLCTTLILQSWNTRVHGSSRAADYQSSAVELSVQVDCSKD